MIGRQLFFVFLAAGILSVGCELLDPNPGPPGLGGGKGAGLVDDNTEVNLTVGEMKYRESCERCHGANAEGTSLFEFSIAGFENTTGVVRKGLRSMPAFPHFTDQTIESIEIFLANQEFPNLTTGQEFFTFYCQRCHGARGEGTSLGDNIRGEDLDDWIEAVREGPDTMPSYTVQQIDDQQIALMRDYIEGL